MHIDDELDAQEEMASEEVTEETKTFQITGVTDGATGQMISFEEALTKVGYFSLPKVAKNCKCVCSEIRTSTN